MNPEIRARFLVTIPPISTAFNEICQLQSIQPSPSGIYTAKLNGTLGNSFINYGYSRSVIIDSAGDDLSGGTFTIKGFQNGAPVTVGPVAGPAANLAIDSVAIFDTVTSIEWSDDLIGSEFSATGGEIAYTRPLFLNWSNPNTNLMSYGLSVRNTPGRTFEVKGIQVFTAGIPIDDQVAAPSTYGIFDLQPTGTDAQFIYRGFAGPAVGGTAVSYPLWDAFIVSVVFAVNDDAQSFVVAFPQIGR